MRLALLASTLILVVIVTGRSLAAYAALTVLVVVLLLASYQAWRADDRLRRLERLRERRLS